LTGHLVPCLASLGRSHRCIVPFLPHDMSATECAFVGLAGTASAEATVTGTASAARKVRNFKFEGTDFPSSLKRYAADAAPACGLARPGPGSPDATDRCERQPIVSPPPTAESISSPIRFPVLFSLSRLFRTIHQLARVHALATTVEPCPTTSDDQARDGVTAMVLPGVSREHTDV